MSSFNQAIESIKNKYYILEEFPLVQRDRFPENCLKRAMSFQEDKVEYYAAHLKNRELDGLLLDLVTTQNIDEINRAIKIICQRKSYRLIKLISILSQYHYDSKSINTLCKEMVKVYTEKQIETNSYIRKFGTREDKVIVLMQAISEEGQDMEAVCKKYYINEKSPLAMEGFLAYFCKCDKTAFLINCKIMITLIEAYSIDEIHEMTLNYLAKLNLIEFNDNVNLAILGKFGQPYVSPEWQHFSVGIRDKFAQWNYLYRLKIHCEGQPEKFRVMVKYFEHVRTNYQIKDGEILITDFGWVVLADVKGSSDSYLYDKRRFENEMLKWQQDEEKVPSFLGNNREIMTARRFMLTEDDSRCIKLTFEDIHYYYIEEVLDIKLGIEPDMRNHDIK